MDKRVLISVFILINVLIYGYLLKDMFLKDDDESVVLGEAISFTESEVSNAVYRFSEKNNAKIRDIFYIKTPKIKNKVVQKVEIVSSGVSVKSIMSDKKGSEVMIQIGESTSSISAKVGDKINGREIIEIFYDRVHVRYQGILFECRYNSERKISENKN